MPLMTGQFHLIQSENWVEYMKSIGVDCMMRDQLTYAIPLTVITKKEDEWSIKYTYTFRHEIKFKLGVQFDETTLDLRSSKSVITQKGDDKLVHVQNYIDCGRTSKIVSEFTDTEMKMTFEGPGNVVSTRIFQRNEDMEKLKELHVHQCSACFFKNSRNQSI